MITIPDLVLSDVLNKGLIRIKNNPNVIDQIFATTPLKMRGQLKQVFANGIPNVVRGYPLKQSETPTFVITLGQEEENEHSLGNFVDDDEFELEAIEDEEERKEELLCRVYKDDQGRLVVKTVTRPIDYVESIFNNLTETTHIEGFSVIDVEKGVIDVSSLDVDVYDNLTVTAVKQKSGASSYGSMFNTTMGIETWTHNGDLTVCMYTLLKYILLASKDELYKSGFYEVKIAGGDLEFLAEYSPERVYRRIITLSFKMENTVEKEYGFISDVKVNGIVGGEGNE